MTHQSSSIKWRRKINYVSWYWVELGDARMLDRREQRMLDRRKQGSLEMVWSPWERNCFITWLCSKTIIETGVDEEARERKHGEPDPKNTNLDKREYMMVNNHLRRLLYTRESMKRTSSKFRVTLPTETWMYRRIGELSQTIY